MIKGDLTNIQDDSIVPAIRRKLGTLPVITLKDSVMLTQYRDALVGLAKERPYDFNIVTSAINWAAAREQERKTGKIASSAFKGVLGELSGDDALTISRKFLTDYWAYGCNLPPEEKPADGTRKGRRIGDF